MWSSNGKLWLHQVCICSGVPKDCQTVRNATSGRWLLQEWLVDYWQNVGFKPLSRYPDFILFWLKRLLRLWFLKAKIVIENNEMIIVLEIACFHMISGTRTLRIRDLGNSKLWNSDTLLWNKNVYWFIMDLKTILEIHYFQKGFMRFKWIFNN